MMLIFILSIYIDNFLRLPVGVQSNGIGGITTIIDEGLSVFHNPALISETKFNFTLSRWFNETNLLNLGACYRDNGFGISYLNYGTIQGYDEYGNTTNQFNPYDLNIGLARSFGNFGISVKSFQTRIDSLLYIGVIGGVGSYFTWEKIVFGAKIDNIGTELHYNTKVQPLICTGGKVTIEDFEVYLEIKGLDFELSNGLLYSYENLKVFLGMKYVAPEQYIEQISLNDFQFSGGLSIKFEEYEIGYSFLYTQFSNAHQIGIIFNP